jgi:hypothetical protein
MTEHPRTDGPDPTGSADADADAEAEPDAREAADLARLSAIHATLAPADRDFEAPPPAVWEAIARAVDAEGALHDEDDDAGSAAPSTSAPSTSAPSTSAPSTPAPSTPAASVPAPPTSVTSLQAHRAPGRRAHRARRWLAAAAIAVLLAAIAGGGLLAARRDRGGGTELASAQLSNAGLDPRGEGAHGQAVLVRQGDATYLDLRLVDPPAVTDGYLEVWMIDAAVEGMVSLGPYRGNGRYLVPPGVDATGFPIVDVSDEPLDGLPTHSGISVLRGELV